MSNEERVFASKNMLAMQQTFFLEEEMGEKLGFCKVLFQKMRFHFSFSEI
jgi:hypothetical protein